MASELDDLSSFAAVVRAAGFREAARGSRSSASALSEAVRRLEDRMGVRLLNRTTRSVAPTEAGQRLYERLAPALGELNEALDAVNAFRERPAGTLRLNVPANVARGVLPRIIVPFLEAYPDIRLEITAEDSFVDLLAAGADAGIRYDERLEQDMIALPIGPRTQRFAAAAAPSYLDARGRPRHPRDLLEHNCLRTRFAGGTLAAYEFEKNGEIVRIDPPGQLVVRPGAAGDLLIASAVAGLGIINSFEDILTPHFESGALEPVLEDWWETFSGPFLYYPGRRHLPAPLRAFVDFVKSRPSTRSAGSRSRG
jgi:DNA-binding transcriptional LysR family regulator